MIDVSSISSTAQQTAYGPYILFALALIAGIAGWAFRRLLGRIDRIADTQETFSNRLSVVETKQNLTASKVGVSKNQLEQAERNDQ